MAELIQALSRLAIPLLIFSLLVLSAVRKVRVYEVFVEGAKNGFETAIQILPYLLAMFVAIGVLRDSGTLDIVLGWIGPLFESIGVPREILPLAVLRPLSGSGALGVMSDLFAVYGPDSPIGLMASTIQGSTETTFYVLTVYFGAVGIRKTRHALAVGLWADLLAFFLAVFTVHLLFAARLSIR